MPRISGLAFQLAALMIAVVTILIVHNGNWGLDKILVWTGMLAIALSAITTGQIVGVVRHKARVKQAQRSMRRMPRSARSAETDTGIRHTARLKRAVEADGEAARQRAREESRRLNVEADIRAMKGADNVWS